jgi:hypothetical protein
MVVVILVEAIELTGIRTGLVESHLDWIERLDKSSSLGMFYVLGSNDCDCEYWTVDDDTVCCGVYTLSLSSVFRLDAFLHSSIIF